MAEVAARAGVSVQTVSNVLNSPAKVRPATQRKVLAAIRALDYTPNLAARRLRSAKASTIAVRLDSNAAPATGGHGLYSGYVQDEFVFQLIAAAEARDIKVIVYTASSQADEVDRLAHLLKSRDADGVVLTSTTENDRRLKVLRELDAPFISFGRPWGADDLYSTEHPWVDVDGAQGTGEATELFWSRGHREIGFLGWPFRKHRGSHPESVNEDRFLGWQTAMQNCRPGVKATELKSLAEFNEESVAAGRTATRQLLERRPQVTAIVCASDTLALGATLAVGQLGRRDIEVSGFDNSPASQEFGFTSLDQGLADVADQALQVLMGDAGDQIRHVDFAAEETEAHVLMQARLIPR